MRDRWVEVIMLDIHWACFVKLQIILHNDINMAVGDKEAVTALMEPTVKEPVEGCFMKATKFNLIWYNTINSYIDCLLVHHVTKTMTQPHIDCEGECDQRCKLSSRPNLCRRARGTCCDRCNRVPSGTFGHYEECSCYANMTTHDSHHKCP
ncbi:hypothetical protein K1719_033530 [Acacia pycnantha]|nr:hypothetical protein K1719_033530 [Acacia pycnantha]